MNITATLAATKLAIVHGIEAALHDLETLAGLAAKYAPEEAAVAEAAEVIAGHPELVPITADAAAAVQSVGTLTQSTSIDDAIQNAKAAVATVKATIAAAAGPAAPAAAVAVGA